MGRYLDALAAGVAEAQLNEYLNKATDAYYLALELTPIDASYQLAVSHMQLGVIFSYARDSDRALEHYRRAIQYCEFQDNRFQAGQARSNAAVTLAEAGRRHDALLYAWHPYTTRSRGPGGAAGAETVRRFIAILEQEPSDEPDIQPGNGT